MKVYKGFTASPGLVLGQVSRLDRPPLVFGEGPFHPEQEKQALEDAIKVAQQELDEMAGRAALTESLPDCRYFPAYEILMDDLRDYRFYERDMVHPSETAIEYIWETFRRNILDERNDRLFNRAEALHRAMEHRPFDPSGEAHRRFRNRQAEEARALQRQYPDLDFSEEIKFFES